MTCTSTSRVGVSLVMGAGTLFIGAPARGEHGRGWSGGDTVYVRVERAYPSRVRTYYYEPARVRYGWGRGETYFARDYVYPRRYGVVVRPRHVARRYLRHQLGRVLSHAFRGHHGYRGHGFRGRYESHRRLRMGRAFSRYGRHVLRHRHR